MKFISKFDIQHSLFGIDSFPYFDLFRDISQDSGSVLITNYLAINIISVRDIN
jgi:hypothetical protein